MFYMHFYFSLLYIIYFLKLCQVFFYFATTKLLFFFFIYVILKKIIVLVAMKMKKIVGVIFMLCLFFSLLWCNTITTTAAITRQKKQSLQNLTILTWSKSMPIMGFGMLGKFKKTVTIKDLYRSWYLLYNTNEVEGKCHK